MGDRGTVVAVYIAEVLVAAEEVAVAAEAMVAAEVAVAHCSLTFRTGCRNLHLQPDCRILDNTFIKPLP